MSKVTCFDSLITMDGSWILTIMKLLVIYIYNPQEISTKILLWSQILSYITQWNGKMIVTGDSN